MASDFKNSVAGMDLLINYDPTLLTINSITPNTTLGGALFNKNYASNLIYISYLAENDTNFNLNSGVIAILNFTVISGSNTNANLTFKTTSPGLRSKLYDKYGSNKPANFASGLLTIAPLPIPTLSSISIVHPTNKLSYIVGDLLDISGLEVVGHYTDNSLAVLPITTANISGFNSSFPAITQILTIVFSGKTTTYAVAINPLIITTPTLTIGSIITTNGSHISVPIMASDFTNSIAGMDLLINYDPTLLTIDSITPTTTLGGALFNKNYAPNLMYVSYLAENDTNFNLNSGVIAILNFTVISGSNTTANLIFKTTAPGIRSKLYDKYGSNMLMFQRCLFLQKLI